MSDLAKLSDDDLRDCIREVKGEADRISYDRRILHGRIDVVRSEMRTRIQFAHGEGPPDDSLEGLLARLASALTHTGPPPLDAELAEFGAADEDESTIAHLLEGEEMPELGPLTDADLAAVARALARQERATSERRNALHVDVDALRKEHVERLRTRYADEAEET